MPEKPYVPERRPIASRERKTSQRIARWLVQHEVSPNAISVFGMVAGIAAGGAFAVTCVGGFQRPAFVAADEIFATEEYEHYVEEFPHRARDSGIGYGFAIFRAGLTWHPLAKSNRATEDSFFGAIHGDLIFHLGAAAGPLKLYPGAERAKT